MKSRLCNLIYSVILIATVAAEAACGPADEQASAVPQFQEGDTVCFIGDSITNGGIYHSDILLYYATRFPNRHFEAHNCGISGDSAAGAVRRYSWDIQPNRPTVATIMFGMNDVNRGLYEKELAGPENEKRRQNALDSHVASMRDLAKLLSEAGCKRIFITPSIYDQTGTQSTQCYFGVNDALGTCGQAACKLAQEFEGTVVDFHGPMTAINAKLQEQHPDQTIVGGDRVHPGQVGHLIMAYLFLKAQQVPATVAQMTIDAAGASMTAQENCTMNNLKGSADGVTFDCLENALPFPIPNGAEDALSLVPLMNDLNREMLVVAGLKPGKYEIVIDDQVVAIKSAEELAAGVNLAEIKTTPQYVQALKVLQLNEKRFALTSYQMRSIAVVKHCILDDATRASGDPEVERRFLDEKIDLFKKDGRGGALYWAATIEQYRNVKPREKQIAEEAANTWKAIYAENQPKPHHFAVRPADSPKK